MKNEKIQIVKINDFGSTANFKANLNKDIKYEDSKDKKCLVFVGKKGIEHYLTEYHPEDNTFFGYTSFF